MSNKLKLVSKLEGTFPVEITVTDLNGEEFAITFDGIARTQKVWSKERDAMIAEAREKIKAETAKPKKKAKTEDAEVDDISIAAIAEDRLNSEAKLAFKIASGWSLEEPFDIENVEELEDRFPGSIYALHEEYSKSIYGNRRKN